MDLPSALATPSTTILLSAFTSACEAFEKVKSGLEEHYRHQGTLAAPRVVTGTRTGPLQVYLPKRDAEP